MADSHDPLGPWEVIIEYRCGWVPPKVLTPPGGVEFAEAQSIYRTYRDAAAREGGDISTRSLQHFEATAA